MLQPSAMFPCRPAVLPKYRSLELLRFDGFSRPELCQKLLRIFIGHELGRLDKSILSVHGRDQNKIFQSGLALVSIYRPPFASEGFRRYCQRANQSKQGFVLRVKWASIKEGS